MMVTDTQVHIWGPDRPDRPWPKAQGEGRTAQAQRADALGHEELLTEMARAGVTRAVIVPPSWEGERNDLALEAARLHPNRFAVMGRISPEAPGARALVEAWPGMPGALGFRVMLGEGAAWAEDVDHWFWAAAERRGLPLMLAARGRMQLIGRLAERRPGLNLLVDHMGARVPFVDDAAYGDFPDLLRLARLPNVAVKASGQPCYSSLAYPWRNLHDRLRQAFDAFGPQRMFWGSDMSRLPCSYRQAVEMFTQELDWLTGSDLEMVMGEGALAWLGWETAPASVREASPA